ncbi:MAG: tRNA pseudouridine(55) synthase TruB [Clostridiales bacterium]|nr:tRNA pseudouridine(55) synthase TruB [Clostridiales bacterium]
MNGIVNVYKEQGFTSFDVVAKLRKIFHTKKIGHTGTLDPLAEGVLPVCIGNATKVCGLLTDKDKEYVTTFKLGFSTDTQDITGTVINEADVNCTEEEIRAVINSFVGKINQLTPMYSARKVNGRKLYEYAREGLEVERKTKEVTIKKISDVVINMKDRTVSMRVLCEKGTYIRTLCNDIGEKLGCLATMTELKRTMVDIFLEENALRLRDIEILVNAGREDACLIPTDTLFLNYHRIDCSEEQVKFVLNGNKFAADYFDYCPEEEEIIRVYYENSFLALYERAGDELKVKAMFL